jgi:hypothetical protein
LWGYAFIKEFVFFGGGSIKGSKTIQSKAEEKLRGDSTPSTVMSNFDDNAVMIEIAPAQVFALCH